MQALYPRQSFFFYSNRVSYIAGSLLHWYVVFFFVLQCVLQPKIINRIGKTNLLELKECTTASGSCYDRLAHVGQRMERCSIPNRDHTNNVNVSWKRGINLHYLSRCRRIHAEAHSKGRTGGEMSLFQQDSIKFLLASFTPRSLSPKCLFSSAPDLKPKKTRSLTSYGPSTSLMLCFPQWSTDSALELLKLSVEHYLVLLGARDVTSLQAKLL